MQIREATYEDIPRIVSLLKISLGEDLMPKSEGYWRWKHVENPFGASPVLIAEADNEVVGVRAFMRWSWISSKGRVEAVRAVDTATHPAFQGKGIFTKLSTALLKVCETRGIQLVFNTPNSKSLPGYLKMGWIEAGKYPVAVRLRRPFRIGWNMLSRAAGQIEQGKDNSVSYYLDHPGMSSLLSRAASGERWVTAHSVKSLKWRYVQVPVAKYYAACVEKNGSLHAVLFYRLKNTRLGLELRVTDFFSDNDDRRKDLVQVLQTELKRHHVDFATFAAFQDDKRLFTDIFTFSRSSGGPIVTVRKIQQVDLEDFQGFKNWHPSPGDLELF